MKIICKSCGKKKDYYAKGMCPKCYRRLYMRVYSKTDKQKTYKRKYQKVYQKTPKFKAHRRLYLKVYYRNLKRDAKKWREYQKEMKKR